MPLTLTTPASAASSRIFSTWRGSSLMPGMSGATRTLTAMPLRLSSAAASSRAYGLGVRGSLARHAFSSIVGTEKAALKSPMSLISLSSAMSRVTSGDFVSTEHGVRESRSASQIPGMSL